MQAHFSLFHVQSQASRLWGQRIRVGLGVPKGMLGPFCPSHLDRLAFISLVSDVIVLFGAIRIGILPHEFCLMIDQSRLAQSGFLSVLLFFGGVSEQAPLAPPGSRCSAASK